MGMEGEGEGEEMGMEEGEGEEEGKGARWIKLRASSATRWAISQTMYGIHVFLNCTHSSLWNFVAFRTVFFKLYCTPQHWTLFLAFVHLFPIYPRLI